MCNLFSALRFDFVILVCIFLNPVWVLRLVVIIQGIDFLWLGLVFFFRGLNAWIIECLSHFYAVLFFGCHDLNLSQFNFRFGILILLLLSIPLPFFF